MHARLSIVDFGLSGPYFNTIEVQCIADFFPGVDNFCVLPFSPSIQLYRTCSRFLPHELLKFLQRHCDDAFPLFGRSL